ncbi:glycosyltransferase family 9 protein [uncultured Algibacter sp.]|uniref:glycosyltransferase family 9 protein n=1 Tax=uncultured Algibacter sp. TaxID=298659 RepID=UPI0026255456|nr:glycosyltransferase family 9 protein [uncultured Algibacter sp.]
MSFKTRVNHIRRTVIWNLAKSVGNSYTEPEYGSCDVLMIKKVLIIRPNHRLGNQLLLTPLVQEVTDLFPNCEIDLFVKGGVAHPVFENYKSVINIIKLPKRPWSHIFKYIKCWLSIKQKKYDFVINGDRTSSSGRLLTQIAKADFKIFGEVDDSQFKNLDGYQHMSIYPVYNLRLYLKNLGVSMDIVKPVPVLDIKLNETEIINGKKVLDGVVPDQLKKTICIYTNATGDKCYSETWWETFYARLLKEYPDYNVIEMLPIENISKINFKAPNFYSQDLREMAAIIRNTSVFIAADNGVMHLASASLAPTLGFFSVTSLEMYKPYGNGNVALQTNETTINDWIKAIDNILS